MQRFKTKKGRCTMCDEPVAWAKAAGEGWRLFEPLAGAPVKRYGHRVADMTRLHECVQECAVRIERLKNSPDVDRVAVELFASIICECDELAYWQTRSLVKVARAAHRGGE